ncbi:MAG: hypothetical protein U1F24_10450 [Alphaproteobacteria bacterium]
MRLILRTRMRARRRADPVRGRHPHDQPALLAMGSAEQKGALYLPGDSRGHGFLVYQGFSETGAGSDLAALQLRAVREGRAYVLNGADLDTGARALAASSALGAACRRRRSKDGITSLLIDIADANASRCGRSFRSRAIHKFNDDVEPRSCRRRVGAENELGGRQAADALRRRATRPRASCATPMAAAEAGDGGLRRRRAAGAPRRRRKIELTALEALELRLLYRGNTCRRWTGGLVAAEDGGDRTAPARRRNWRWTRRGPRRSRRRRANISTPAPPASIPAPTKLPAICSPPTSSDGSRAFRARRRARRKERAG